MEILHFQTRAEEHHHLLVAVLSKKREEQEESFLWRTYNIALQRQPDTVTASICTMLTKTWQFKMLINTRQHALIFPPA